MSPRVSVIIPHYFAVRAPHLLRIAADLRQSTLSPAEILVWNNDRAGTLPDLSRTGMTVIQSPRNEGSRARLLAAQRASDASAYLCFMDNDITFEPQTLASLVAWAERLPGSVVTLEGRASRPVGEPYERWPKYRGASLAVPALVAMSLGRGELVPAAIARRMLTRFPQGDMGRMDDLWWSACAAWERVPIYVVPCTRGVSGLINLPEFRTGISMTHNYGPERDAALAAIRGYNGHPRIWNDAS